MRGRIVSGEAIERLAARAQAVPAPARWIYAQQDVILALGSGQSPERGPRTARADRVLALSARLGLGRLPVWLGSLALLLILYVRQLDWSRRRSPASTVFVGVGALPDPQLAEVFAGRLGRPITLLDERDLANLARVRRVGLKSLIGAWLRSWRELAPHLARSQVEGLDTRYVRACALLRLHAFAYCRAWFDRHRAATGQDRMGFSATSHVAYAAIAAGIRAAYFPHGFQRKAIVLPDFMEVHATNRYEAEHFRRRLPHAVILPAQLPGALPSTERVAAVAGEFWHLTDYELCRPFIEWARREALPVIVRPHPRDETGYWDRWRDVTGVAFDTTPSSFDEFLERVRPRFLMTWTSTTLFDATARGVVAVTVAPEDADQADYVVPLRGIALQWPEEAELIANLLDDPKACRRETERRRRDMAFEPMPPTDARTQP